MNERIKELAIQAVGDYSKDDYWPFFEEELAKFAELVALDCADTVLREAKKIADSMSKVNAANYIDVAEKVGMINAAITYSGKIKEQFGVEQ